MIHHDWSIMIHGKIAPYPLHPHAFSSLKAIGVGICWHPFGHLPSTCQVSGSYMNHERQYCHAVIFCDIVGITRDHCDKPIIMGIRVLDHGDIHWWAMVFRGISTPMIPKINGIQWPWLRRVMVNASICHIMSYVNARRHLCANMRKYEHRGSVVGKCWEWYAGRFQESTCLWVCMIVWYIILFENVRKSVASQFYSILIQFRRKSEDHRCSRNLWKKIIP